ncbi:hypothetical protein V8C42DRAFT_338668 [Trichoderma barbatum]
MASFLVQSDNCFLADAGSAVLGKDEPPPNYNESHLSTSADNRGLKTNTESILEFIKFSHKLIEIFNSVISMPDGVMHLIEGFRVVLCHQPLTKQVQILDIIHTLSGIRNEGLFGNSRGNFYAVSTVGEKNKEQLEGNETSARSSHTQHKQHSVSENLPPNIKEPIRMKRSKNTLLIPTQRGKESAVTDIIVLGTPASSSELSSPESISTPSRIHNNIIEETTEILDCEQSVLQILEQPIEEFARESCEQIRPFASLEDPATYKVLYDSLKYMEDEKKPKWSSGTEWASLVTKGYNSRQIGSVNYAMTAMAFTKWHTSQVALLSDMSSSTASQLVTRRLIGNKPDGGDEQKNWDRQRKKINTHLARGRKWCRLVKNLSIGILFKNPWDLVKTKDAALTWFIEKISEDQGKMFILKSLTTQLEYLINNGKTDNRKFENELRREGYLADNNKKSVDTLLDTLYSEVEQSISSKCRSLLIHGTHTLEVDSLQRLKGNTWLNDDVIIACLHLSDKMEFVRIGFSVPIHKPASPNSPIKRPFERTAAQVATWHKELGESLVCFFPLLQYNNHFTLLEINYREGYIFHYNSIKSNCNDVKEAYEKEQVLSNFRFIEQEAIQQTDYSSCGLMVIKHAQSRMWRPNSWSSNSQ